MQEKTIDKKYIHKLISNNIKRLRNLKNLSQLNLSYEAELTHNFINDIENCKKGISVNSLAKISTALKVEPYQLFLPEGINNNEVYAHDFKDTMQKAVAEIVFKYFPDKRQE